MLHDSYKTIQQEYTYWLDTLGFSESLVYDYSFRVSEFLTWLQLHNIIDITTLNTNTIYKYFDHLEHRSHRRKNQRGLSTSHLNHNFSAVDKLLEFLHHQGLQTVPPPTQHRIASDDFTRIQKIQALSIDEIKQLQSLISNTFTHYTDYYREPKQEQLKLVFALHYACGLRRTEAKYLEIKDINFDRKTLHIRRGKNYKERLIPINQSIYKALEHYIYNFRNLYKLPHQRIFISDTQTLNRGLQQLQEASTNQVLKNKTITLHTLRHSIATHLLQAGMSIENISRFLGHSSLESTQIYTHISSK